MLGERLRRSLLRDRVRDLERESERLLDREDELDSDSDPEEDLDRERFPFLSGDFDPWCLCEPTARLPSSIIFNLIRRPCSFSPSSFFCFLVLYIYEKL